MEISTFLRTVVTTEEGQFCLSFSNPDGSGWFDKWFNWPNDLDIIVETIEQLREKSNVYFSSYLFSDRKAIKENVLPSKTIQADLDEADLSLIKFKPSVIVCTSKGRHQAYWILNNELDLEEHEILSKKITYSIDKCDHSGWALGRRVRPSGSLNHKYLKPHNVYVVDSSLKVYESGEFDLLPSVSEDETTLENWSPKKLDIGPQELLERTKGLIPPKVYLQYNVQSKDRSAALWALMCAGFRANLNRDEVFLLALHSQNNKFSNLRYNGDRELAKDVLRAERAVKVAVTDIKEAIANARKLPVAANERRQSILLHVIKGMTDQGSFIRTYDDMLWYIRNDLGRPVIITPRSEYLSMILDLQYGLNPVEVEQSYTVAGLSSYARALPVAAITGSLSHYDAPSNTLLLHTGKKDVLRITSDGINVVTNGSCGIVFPWSTTNEHFKPNLESRIDWAKAIFEGALDSITNFPQEEACALLKVWFIFLLLRSGAVSRPILAFFGQPGAGKSTLARRLYAVIYGKNRSLGAVTNTDDFDQAVSTDPFVVLDNVDTWERWLPDRLALAASTSDIVKRKLYTDIDTITIKRNALVGITAHNPRFGREDVADRLIMFVFERLKHFLPEGDIISAILGKRNDIWGSLVFDLQKVLAQEQPTPDAVPQFRVEDFARLGFRIALAIGSGNEFSLAVERMRASQRSFSLEEDQILVTSIQRMVEKHKENGRWYTSSNLWSQLEACSSDPKSFTKSYHNAVVLGKKLWSLQESLKEVFDIQWQFDKVRGTRLWQIGRKES